MLHAGALRRMLGSDNTTEGSVNAPDAAALLAWYDRHARKLPWRVGPKERAAGVKPDPVCGLALRSDAPADHGERGGAVLHGASLRDGPT